MSGSGDFISREAAIEAMYKDAEAHPEHTFWTSQHEALLTIHAADVRPIVYCRDCKHAEESLVSGCVYCNEMERARINEGWCAWGEPNCGAKMEAGE